MNNVRDPLWDKIVAEIIHITFVFLGHPIMTYDIMSLTLKS